MIGANEHRLVAVSKEPCSLGVGLQQSLH